MLTEALHASELLFAPFGFCSRQAQSHTEPCSDTLSQQPAPAAPSAALHSWDTFLAHPRTSGSSQDLWLSGPGRKVPERESAALPTPIFHTGKLVTALLLKPGCLKSIKSQPISRLGGFHQARHWGSSELGAAPCSHHPLQRCLGRTSPTPDPLTPQTSREVREPSIPSCC